LVRRLLFLVSFASAAAAAGAACTDTAVAVEVGNEDAGGFGTPTSDGGGDARTDLPVAQMRVAHVAEGMGAIDFCYKGARSGASIGPVRRASAPADAGDAGDPGIAYGDVSRYFTLESAGSMTITIVSAGAASCASALAAADVTLDPGKSATVVVFAQSTDGGPRPLSAFVDDPNTAGGKARVRVVHGADRFGALAARAATTTTTLIAERVEPRRVSSASAIVPVDTLGYATIEPIATPASLAIDFLDASAPSWQSGARDLALVGGSLHTAFVLVDGTSSVDVVWCADQQNIGDRTSCLRLP
jgi:hypothetical protein